MNTKTLAGAILIIGIAALLFLNFNPMVNNRYQSDSDNTNTNSTNDTEVESRLKDFPRDNLPTQTEKWDQLETEVVMEGNTGDERAVSTGNSITVNYIGWLASDGTVFDSSLNQGRSPYTFTVGTGVIEGWSQGVVGMKIGEIRQLMIPSELAYAEYGQGTIGPNEDLYFYVELLSINL